MPGVRSTLCLLAIIVGSFLALHNVRLGRGDRRGAGRLVVFVLLLRYKLSILVTTLLASITMSRAGLLLVLILRAAVRPPWVAVAVAWFLLSVLQRAATGCDASLPWLSSSIFVAISMVMLVRFGLIALITNLFVMFSIVNSPVTCNFRAWYAPASTSTIVLAAVLLSYGFFTALGGRLILWRRLFDS